MCSTEAAEFESHSDFKAMIAMRQWDDLAKNKTIPIHSNAFYEDLCRKFLQ